MTYLAGINFRRPVVSEALDPFARFVVANPETLFDSKLLYDKAPLFWDESLAGGATSVHSTANADVTMGVSGAGQTAIRQTKTCWNYQPGKGQIINMTGIIGAASANSVARIGTFDANDGLFFERDGTTFNVVKRKGTSDTSIAQANWNMDKFDGTGPSGVTIDFSKAQIFFIAFEWLGVGSATFGFFVNGVPRFAHTFEHFNQLTDVYMATPNNPIRYEISSTGGTSDLIHICSTVISSGGRQNSGLILGEDMYSASGPVDANVVGTVYAVLGIRLKSTHLDSQVQIINASMLGSSSDDYQWMIVVNPTIGGPGSLTWSDVTNSALQKGLPNFSDPSTTTLTNWDALIGTGVVEAGFSSGSVAQEIQSRLYLGADISGTPDEFILAVRPLVANADIRGTLTWQELL